MFFPGKDAILSFPHTDVAYLVCTDAPEISSQISASVQPFKGVWVQNLMRLTYNPQKDTLHILLCSAPIQASETLRSGLILDYDCQGNIICLELPHASAQMSLPDHKGMFEYAASDRPEESRPLKAALRKDDPWKDSQEQIS